MDREHGEWHVHTSRGVVQLVDAWIELAGEVPVLMEHETKPARSFDDVANGPTLVAPPIR